MEQEKLPNTQHDLELCFLSQQMLELLRLLALKSLLLWKFKAVPAAGCNRGLSQHRYDAPLYQHGAMKLGRVTGHCGLLQHLLLPVGPCQHLCRGQTLAEAVTQSTAGSAATPSFGHDGVVQPVLETNPEHSSGLSWKRQSPRATAEAFPPGHTHRWTTCSVSFPALSCTCQHKSTQTIFNSKGGNSTNVKK